MSRIVVTVLFRKIPLETLDAEEHVRWVVRHRESKTGEIDPDGRLREMTVAILTMLKLGDDLCKEQQRLREMRSKVRTKSTFLLEKLQETRYLC